MDREKLIEEIEKRNSPATDEAGLDDEFDDSEDDFNEHRALPPEEKQMNPLEERQAKIEAIYEKHDLKEAKSRVEEARQKEADLEEAEDLLYEQEEEKELREAALEEEREENRLDEDDPVRDVLDRLTEDGIDTSKVDLDKAEIQARMSGKPLDDYRTWETAVKKQGERDKLVKKHPGETYHIKNEDEKLRISEQRQADVDSEIYEGGNDKRFNETKVDEVQPETFEDWLAEEYPEIAQYPDFREAAAQELNKLLAQGKPNNMGTQEEACNIIETRMAIAEQRVARGDQTL